MTLDDILTGARRMEKMHRKGPSFWGSDAQFRTDAMNIIPRLARVAEAAVECVDDPFDTGAFERLRAAVRGDRLPQPDGKEGKE